MTTERVKRVFDFGDEPRKKKEPEPVEPPRPALKMMPVTFGSKQDLDWAPQISRKARIKIRFLWDNLPDNYRTALSYSAESRDAEQRNRFGVEVLTAMQREGYDFRIVARINQESMSMKNDEFFELWKDNKCIARLIFSPNGESKMVKVL